MKYSKLVKEFVDNLKVELSGKFYVDETMIKCDGEYKWFWEIIDADTKFLVATHLSWERTIEEVIKLFKQAKKRSAERPKRVVVDGLWAYEKGFKKVFYSRYKEHRVEFVRRAGIKARETNNVIERLHGTLKDRLKPLRGLKSEETAKVWLDGWFVYYNFLRPHLSLKGKTPAEACGIDLKIENGWEDLIREAIYHQTRLTRFASKKAETQVQ